jgi:Holliday junction resolvase RusA-like endonuclease
MPPLDKRLGFSFTLPGQPPSVNHLYEWTRQTTTDRFGQPILDLQGRPKQYRSIAKKPAVAKFQLDVSRIVRTARPTEFRPEHLIILAYEFYLGRDIDCDNAMKAMNDAIALALGVNDNRFIPATFSKVTKDRSPRTVVTVYDGDHWYVTIGVR